MSNILYGYNLETMKKFEVSTEDICQTINCDEGFSDNYFVYTTKEDRDFHYEENIEVSSNGKTSVSNSENVGSIPTTSAKSLGEQK